MLNQIVMTKKEEMKTFKMPDDMGHRVKYSLKKAMLNPTHTIGLIAELKKASPSKGIFKDIFHPKEIAGNYLEGGADALSILTDQTYFQGQLDFIRNVRGMVNRPILRKDFIIDRRQIEESDRIGADVILLIAAILEPSQLQEYYCEAYERGLEAIVEVHSEADLEKTSDFQPAIMGVNNRDLRTFKTDVNHTLSLLSSIPQNTVVISESGVRKKDDINRLAHFGVKGVLVGETLMLDKNPAQAIHHLFYGSGQYD